MDARTGAGSPRAEARRRQYLTRMSGYTWKNTMLKTQTRLGAWLLVASWCLCANVDAAESGQAAESARVSINQIGFVPAAPKMAVVPASAGIEFWVVDVESGTEVLRGPLTEPQTWELAGETVRIADFSAFTKPGRYQVRVNQTEDSASFSIKDGVYDDLLKASIKAYYFNRASAALEERHAGPYQRPAGHPDTIVYIHPEAASKLRPARSVVSSPKGWYDAGDYNKYIVNSGITLYTLGKALLDYPQVFAELNLNIPESQNSLPDLLDEMLWNLDWFETMQDPHDGGVYHKLTTLRFSDALMPHRLYQPRFMMPKSTAATLNYAAVMAFASRIIEPFEKQLPGRAARYRKQAEHAWQWANQHKLQHYVQPKDVNTGLYARITDDFADEWLWAATELYLTTGGREYEKAIRLPEALTEPDWGEVDALAVYSLLGRNPAGRIKVPGKLQGAAEKLLSGAADAMVKQYRQSPYKVPLVRNDFVWGSNAVALNKAMLLLHAHQIRPKEDYAAAAQALLDYVLGRNPTGYAYVTGFGARSPQKPHHRVSEADKVSAPVPGFLVGGPQPGWQDQCKYPSRNPAASYVDNWCSYSTNEVAINWNAPLVYTVAALRQYPVQESSSSER